EGCRAGDGEQERLEGRLVHRHRPHAGRMAQQREERREHQRGLGEGEGHQHQAASFTFTGSDDVRGLAVTVLLPGRVTLAPYRGNSVAKRPGGRVLAPGRGAPGAWGILGWKLHAPSRRLQTRA